jgi:hypothetical protein
MKKVAGKEVRGWLGRAPVPLGGTTDDGRIIMSRVDGLDGAICNGSGVVAGSGSSSQNVGPLT